jgi:hypothetical protein
MEFVFLERTDTAKGLRDTYAVEANDTTYRINVLHGVVDSIYVRHNRKIDLDGRRGREVLRAFEAWRKQQRAA